MTVYIVIRENRNDHGFIDTSIIGVYRDQGGAKRAEAADRDKAVAEGLRPEAQDGADVEDEDQFLDDWQVSWKVEAYDVL